jgi:uncharacterized 2Fe-2S/4Fe-4S cluster protein (DUF4445 family)
MDLKAAACSAIGAFLKKCLVQKSDIRHVYLDDASGAYIDIKKDLGVGILPEFSNTRSSSLSRLTKNRLSARV